MKSRQTLTMDVGKIAMGQITDTGFICKLEYFMSFYGHLALLPITLPAVE